MRKKIVAGNWKMNMNFDEGIKLIENIISKINMKASLVDKKDTGVILAPPFIILQKASELCFDNQMISIGSQNCSQHEKGAFTGEISAAMIKSTGANYVIIGHSERRKYFHENNETLSEKVKLVLENNLFPIFCCGEILSERKSGRHFEVVKKQLEETIFKFNKNDFQKIVLAYEPVWAIGTGVTASPEQAQEMHNFIRELIKNNFNKDIAEQTTILYGGSCNAKNASTLFANPDVDGGLIGGASLKADDFVDIIYSF
ncbi:MAG: triose-phosphate isomerase [Bacteroidales bacterium]|nr:triose-phosphate isomerase [Bacteroidales bacterium]